VTLIVFNRPLLSVASFEQVRRQQPTDLFVIADGPRPGHPTDVERCAEVREIVSSVDWECRARYDFAEVNLGLKQRIVSGLNEVFSQVDRAIVLEDDCVPNDDFFTFCTSMLDRYRDDERVVTVTGSNFQNGQCRGDGSYYFSKYNHCWGWATWARAWALNDPALEFWENWHQSDAWPRHCPDPVERKCWELIFRKVRSGEINSWAYPWMASVWRAGGLTATPNVNLVANLGFGLDATNTSTAEAGPPRPVTPLGEIRHPTNQDRDVDADRYVFDHTYGGAALRQRSLRNYPKLALRSIRYRLSRLGDRRSR
jgi:hypothetical protein